MLTQTDAATIRAALAFWRDEIAPGGLDTARHYFDESIEAPLNAGELSALSDRFRWNQLLFIEADPDTGRIISDRLLPVHTLRDADTRYVFACVDRD